MMNSSICSPTAIQTPSVFGAEILSLSASWVTNYSTYIFADFNYNGGAVSLDNARFCNITVTYTHPGYDDRITVETWLPSPEQWNGRLQATGGGGWAAGRWLLSDTFMGGALGEGYATTTTDAGLGIDTTGPTEWALTSPGNIDYVALNNFGSRAYNDQALIGKSLVRSFYGRAPEYSYWSGCSQGGRQGLMLAERYPSAYDGIAASAPAQSWTKFTSSLYYPLFMRIWHNVSPLVCELDFLTSEAIAACDPLDGVVDGLISNMTACNYNPYTAVNKTFSCATINRTMALSPGAALIADAAWSGAQTTDGHQLWFGYNPGSDIGSTFGSIPGFNISVLKDEWFNLFVAKNASFDSFGMSHEQYQEFFHLATQEYADALNAADPDLSAFKAAGGKLITYHGMADPQIPTKGTEFLYEEVQARFPDIHEFWRFFESPGLGHCSGGLGGQPTTVLQALRRWVENGTVPETLPVEYPDLPHAPHRILCPYPAQATYIGGNTSLAESFRCV
ncbi:feruloyl esterase [Aspergillus japonicus CBS 114.51]|uniref:Carboxylic ester hydrolase n=1 Tax=Aspergillus japonicus CBS 114.51 TaxID=1448312 RepID=A0A8T8XG25_ASPJA|nr:feruloyl esterase [Aspergillus japonicus CBS 114.51]RAH87257.1 feruloyl esterase [Aspergillus japonicus CBS 114.51]